MRLNTTPFKVVWPFFVVSIFYICFSDWLLGFFIENHDELVGIEIAKGVCYVMLSSLLIYYLVKRYVAIINKHNEQAIHKQKQADTAILQSELLFRSTFDQAAVGIAHLDVDGNFLRVNQCWCSLVARPHEQVMQMKLLELFHPDAAFSPKEIGRCLLNGSLETYIAEHRFVTANSKVKWVEVTMSLVKPEAGLPAFFVMVVQDIDDKKLAQSELDSSNADLDKFIYRSSHDLRGPLATLSGLCHVAEMDVTDTKALEYIGYFTDTVGKMDKNLFDLMLLARIKQNKRKDEWIQVKPLVDEIVYNYLKTEPQTNYTVSVNIDDTSNVYADLLLLKASLISPIENAIIYRKMQAIHHVVAIDCTIDNSGYHFTITDNGIGIAATELPQIFDLFYRGKNSNNGKGLGLYVSKVSIKLLNGSVEAESTQGVGTVIKIFIPVH